MPFTANIANLNADDIENITILKDAASTSLYGSRAANGVVMVTTKKGKKGSSQINLKYTKGFSDRSVPEYDRIGATDYYPIMWESYRNSLSFRASNPLTLEAANTEASRSIVNLLGYNAFSVPDGDLVSTNGVLNPNATLVYREEDLNWEAPLVRRGDRDELNLNLSGASDNSDYYVSFGRIKDDGFLIRSSFER